MVRSKRTHEMETEHSAIHAVCVCAHFFCKLEAFLLCDSISYIGLWWTNDRCESVFDCERTTINAKVWIRVRSHSYICIEQKPGINDWWICAEHSAIIGNCIEFYAPCKLDAKEKETFNRSLDCTFNLKNFSLLEIRNAAKSAIETRVCIWFLWKNAVASQLEWLWVLMG